MRRGSVGTTTLAGTALALEFIGERWSLLIMRELVFGPRRFGEIRANLPGISANVLTQRLASLGDAGIVRHFRLPSPANVQVYDLTDWGRDAAPLMRDMGRWAARSPRHDRSLFMSAALSNDVAPGPDRSEARCGTTGVGRLSFPRRGLHSDGDGR